MVGEPHKPTAGLVIIGAEVLSGKVDDANGPFLIRALRSRGVEVCEIRTIGDTVEEISRTVRSLSAQYGLVFTTGGIGPTHDDVTIAGIAAAFQLPVIRHPGLASMLHDRFGPKLNEARLKMADVPEGAEVLLGDGSFVPIVQIRNVTILPGVPALMRACFSQVASPIAGLPFHSKALLLDVSEGDIADALRVVQGANTDVTIGSYPRFDEDSYRVKVTVDGRDPKRVRDTLEAIRQRMEALWIVGEQ